MDLLDEWHAPRRRKSDRVDPDHLFDGTGRVGELMRSVEWSRTALGPIATWSAALRTTVGLLLRNRFPLILWWGPRFVQFYNDAYVPILGAKHPHAMGQEGAECWSEIWDIMGPMVEAPFAGRSATGSDDLLLLINRKGFLEECHFRFAYSPVPDETIRSTGIGGILGTVAETTEQVYAERQLRTLRELSARAAVAKTEEEACRNATGAFAENPFDIPFALLYLIDRGASEARLVSSCGFASADGALSPAVIGAADGEGEGTWPVWRAVRSRQAEVSGCPTDAAVPKGRWSDSPRQVVCVPLHSCEESPVIGVLVVGVSPHRALDDGYRGFLQLAAAQIVTAIQNASAYQQERRRAEALAELDRAKTTFFGNVSHEFRTPLTLMLGPQEDALASPERALAGESLRSVHRSTLRLVKLVNALLDFSRIEANRAQASYEPTDLAALTADIASAFRSAIERGGVRFEVACPALPEPVHVDREMWEKIVLNLISNAFKFTFAGTIRVALTAGDGRVELAVSDTGVGIPSAELPRVFERFHRIAGTRGRTYEGSGIGLALVRDLVALHGGSVHATSEVGVGSVFTVSIPLGTAHLPAERLGCARNLWSSRAGTEPFVEEALRWMPASLPLLGARSASGGNAAVSGAPDPAVVLVADDNADMRDYLVRLLSPHWKVVAVADGTDALAFALDTPPDIVLADVMMPDLDGFGLLRLLRDNPRTADTPVIMLSARAGDEARVSGLEAGSDDYLVKPFAAQELIARVRLHLERSRLRRTAEAERRRLRTLLAEVPVIINFFRGPRLTFEFVHPEAVRVYGGRDVLGRPIDEVWPKLHGPEYPARLRKVLETGERNEVREALLYLDDGHGRLRATYWNVVCLPVRDENQTVQGVMTCEIDVTEQVAARQTVEEHARQLSVANEQLASAKRDAESARVAAENAIRAKDEFLAMLGHELRNPLSPILTSLQLLRRRGTESREQDVLERQVGHLIRLVDDLMDVARIARGRVDLQKERIQMRDVVARGVEMASPLIEQRQQTLRCDLPTEDLVVDGDGDRLAQVVSNLLTNAAKYSDPSSTISVALGREGSNVLLSVTDNGIGIPADMLARIFDMFVQQPQSLDRAQGGLGLGLAIVRSLVEMHGGRVEARSEGVGKGSTFVITLPLASNRVPNGVVAALPSRPDERGGRTTTSKKVLVVDDNVDGAESLAEALRDFGYRVEVAFDGVSAIETALRFKPAVCFLDIGLPLMDGYEVARRLRESDGLSDEFRIIALTGYGQDVDRRRTHAAGFNAHLVKPVSLDALIAAMGDASRGRGGGGSRPDA